MSIIQRQIQEPFLGNLELVSQTWKVTSLTIKKTRKTEIVLKKPVQRTLVLRLPHLQKSFGEQGHAAQTLHEYSWLL